MEIINLSNPWFRTFVFLTIFTFILLLGMSLSIAQLRDYWQQSGQLVRTLLAAVVLPPLLLAALILAVPLPKPVPIALALLAASPCPPFLTQRESKAGASQEVALSIQVTLALVSVVATPIIVRLFQAGFPNATDVRFGPWGIVKMVALVQFLPLGIGFALHQIQADWVEKLARILKVFSKVSLVILAALLLTFTVTTGLLRNLGGLPLIAIAAFNIVLLAVGHLMGIGYSPQVQASMGISAIARNAGLAIFIATSLNRTDAVLTIVAAQLIGILVELPYSQSMKRKISNYPKSSVT